MRGWRRAVAAAALVAFAGGAAWAAKRWYAYDGAGRLVRETDGSGRFREYGYDAAGNVTSSSVRRLWHASVKKPALGAWAFGVDDGGNVSGFGADTTGGFRIAGTLDLSGTAPAGTIEIRDPDTNALLASHLLSGGTIVKEEGGAPLSFTFTGADGTTLLSGKAARPSGAFGAFHGTFGSPKSSVKSGTLKTPSGQVVLFAEGARPAVTGVLGTAEGWLLRDPKGKAWGELTYDGDDYVVQAKLKDGAKSVTVKSVKGSPVPFTLKLKK
jgi:YD repeat-containing protein